MLHYIKIGEFEGVDYTRNSKYKDTGEDFLQSKQCINCNFYFFCKVNFQYQNGICNSCHHCLQYENVNPNMTFKVIKTKKGVFRTVSHYFVVEIERLINTRERNGRFEWLYEM